MIPPPPEVLDLFAVPDAPEPLPGGRRTSFRAGDLVLSPGRAPEVAAWLSPVLARLAVRLDEDPTRQRRDLRVALPVPARDGSWVVDGWSAARHEPGATICEDLDVTLAAGRLLHAQLATTVRTRPPELAGLHDRRAHAERLVFGPARDLLAATAATADTADTPGTQVARAVAQLLDDHDLGSEQLVHVDLAGNVLIDGRGAPLVVDVTPAWRPLRWAEAVCVLDGVLRYGADRAVLQAWSRGARQQAMLRAIAWRALVEPDQQGYDGVLAVVAPT